MFNDLATKRIVIAGGTGLIGKVLVSAFIELGAPTLTIARTGGDIQFDLASGDDSRLDQLLDQDLRPEVWINCTYPKDFRDHLFAYLWSTKRVALWMAKSVQYEAAITGSARTKREKEGSIPWNGGVIINFASIYGGVQAHDLRRYEGTDMYNQEGAEEMLTYSAVKAGIVAGSRALAVDFTPQGVRINCISPGGVSNNQPYDFRKQYIADVPLGRMAIPEDLVGPVMFFAGNASEYVVGANLVVDGGITLG